MDSPTFLTRQEILHALRQRLQPLPYVHAMWEAGAIAFDRVDQWSDIDLQFDVDDNHVEEAFAEVEHALATLSAGPNMAWAFAGVLPDCQCQPIFDD
jgi:hypothetical protein